MSCLSIFKHLPSERYGYFPGRHARVGVVKKPPAAPTSGYELVGLQPRSGREVGPGKATSSDQYEGEARRLAEQGDRSATELFVEDGHADHQADDRVDRHYGGQAGAQRASVVGKLVDQEAERADGHEGVERPRGDQSAQPAVDGAHIFLQQPGDRGVSQARSGTQQSGGGTRPVLRRPAKKNPRTPRPIKPPTAIVGRGSAGWATPPAGVATVRNKTSPTARAPAQASSLRRGQRCSRS